MANLKVILEGFSASYLEMGQKAKQAWEQYFCPERVNKYYSDALLTCIRTGLNTGSAGREIARWKSFATYWSNNWTLPQRFMIKLGSLRSISLG